MATYRRKTTGGATGGTGGKNSSCTVGNPCKGTLAVQRVNSGAYDSQSEQASKSGPIISATVAEAGAPGRAIMSIKRGETRKVNITVVVLGFQNSIAIASPPVELSFGGPQANAALECGGSAGKPKFEQAVAEGCATVYATTSEPNPPICGHDPEVHRFVRRRTQGTASSRTLWRRVWINASTKAKTDA